MIALAERPDLVSRLKQEQKQMVERHGEQITSEGPLQLAAPTLHRTAC